MFSKLKYDKRRSYGTSGMPLKPLAQNVISQRVFADDGIRPNVKKVVILFYGGTKSVESDKISVKSHWDAGMEFIIFIYGNLFICLI